ncbi:MAG: sigma-70 family RNA polymerase sigma factor [Kiritimatiellae bacterium]|nr:sigma-70 family RNA polymerase sigma factor [Kiritimatiellia bacterium]
MGIIKDIRGDIEQEANLLLEKYRDALMLEALSLVSGDKHTAEELVLQTFEAHLFKREKYDPSKGELLPWLKGILRNLHGKSQRDRAMRSITYLSPEELEVLSEIRTQSNATDEEIEANSDAEFVRNAIAQLPENARSALLLHYFESLSVRQIAQILRKSPGSVKGSLHYARKALAKRLGKALGRVALAVGAILFGGTLLYAAAVATGLASSPFVAAEPAAEDVVVFNTKSTEDTESSLEVFEGLDEECLSLDADPTNHESRTTNHETNGDSPQGFEAITVNSNTNNEESTMNTQSVKSAAVRMLAAGAMLSASVWADDKPTYYLASGTVTENDGDGYSASSMNGTYQNGFADRVRGWATAPDGAAVTTSATAGNDYFVTDGRVLRTPWANNAYQQSYTFPGDSLTFVDGMLFTKTGGGHSLTVDDLRVAENGSLFFSHQAGSGEAVLAGNLNIAAGGTFMTSLKSSSTAAISFTINSDISGAGTLYLESTNNNPSTSITNFRLNGDLHAFTGRLVFSNGENNKDAYFYINPTLGDCASPDAQGITFLNNGSSTAMIATSDMTIGPNRGVTVVGRNVIGHANGTTVTIDSPLVGDSSSMIRVTGGGTLRLTNASPDFKGSIVAKYNNSKVVLVGDAVALSSQCSSEDGKGTIDYGVSYAYVDADAPDDREFPYNTPERAAKTITQAMDRLASGGRVYLKAGQTLDLDNEDMSQWKASICLIGGGDHTTVLQATSSKPLTLQNGQSCSNVVVRGSVASNVGWPNGAVNIVNGALIDSIVEQFTQIGVLCTAGRMVGCIVRNNHQNPNVGNNASARGGAVSLASGQRFVLEQCVISNVVSGAQYGAGAIGSLWEGNGTRPSLVLDRCQIVNCRGRSGAMRMGSNKQGYVYATNSLFAANQSIDRGASLANSVVVARGEFVNCTFAANVSADGKYIIDPNNSNEASGSQQNAGLIKFVNTVVSGNGSLATYNANYGQINASHSLFPEASAYSSDNIVGPAVYSGRGASPYALMLDTAGSRAGDASFWESEALDIAGNKRINVRGGNKYVDMGCYQWMAVGSVYYIR